MAPDAFLVQHAGQLFLQLEDGTYTLPGALASLDHLLANLPAAELLATLTEQRGERITFEFAPTAPVENQEIWASGVTYKRSEEAREQESHNSTVYTRVYHAARPELFFKALGPDAVGTGDHVGIRADAIWSVPEPELVVVLNARMEVVGFTIGNDMSSRDIEGENPLYLPQAKVYDRACAIGPRIWLAPEQVEWPSLSIAIDIEREGATVFSGETATEQIHRTLGDLCSYLGRCKSFSRGALLFSGTGIVPPDEFTLQAGDDIRIRVDPIGQLVNSVVVVGRELG